MTKKCGQCNSLFKKPYKYSKLQWSLTTFCSRKCSSENQKIRISTTCIICNTVFKHVPYRDRKVCSIECRNKRIQQIGALHKGKKKTEEHIKKLKEYPHLSGEKHPRFNNWASKNWRRLHPKRANFLTRQRIYRLKNSEGSHTFKEWENLKKKYNYMCLCCKQQEPFIKLTEDHIIPISTGGTNYIDNIQPLCRGCNSRKGIKIIDFNYNVSPLWAIKK